MEKSEEKTNTEDFLNLSGINNNTFELLFEDKDDLTEEEKLTPEQDYPLLEIEYYTQKKLYRLKYKFLKFLIKLNNGTKYYDIKFERKYKTYVYTLPDRVLRFDILSSYYKNEIRHLLESVKRYGKCHSFSLIVGQAFPNSKIVTGYLSSRENIRILHTVIEVPTNDGEAVYVDFTKNLIMAKDTYTSLTNFKVLNEFPIAAHDEELLHLLPGILKPYVLFQEELERDYAKVKKSLNLKGEK